MSITLLGFSIPECLASSDICTIQYAILQVNVIDNALGDEFMICLLSI